jgi:hypothetical protein
MNNIEPREHDDRCRTQCGYAAWGLNPGYACEDGHTDHDCSCDELAEQDAEREAEAFIDWLYDTTP